MASKRDEGEIFRIRLPRHVSEELSGAGDVVKRVTSALGVRPCGGCERRAQMLNRWFPISDRRKP